MSETSVQLRSQTSISGANTSLDSNGNRIMPFGSTQAQKHAANKPRFAEFACSYVEVEISFSERTRWSFQFFSRFIVISSSSPMPWYPRHFGAVTGIWKSYCNVGAPLSSPLLTTDKANRCYGIHKLPTLWNSQSAPRLAEIQHSRLWLVNTAGTRCSPTGQSVRFWCIEASGITGRLFILVFRFIGASTFEGKAPLFTQSSDRRNDDFFLTSRLLSMLRIHQRFGIKCCTSVMTIGECCALPSLKDLPRSLLRNSLMLVSSSASFSLCIILTQNRKRQQKSFDNVD